LALTKSSLFSLASIASVIIVNIRSRKTNVFRKFFNMYQSSIFIYACKVRRENGKENVNLFRKLVAICSKIIKAVS
jgi:hypothetical protein